MSSPINKEEEPPPPSYRSAPEPDGQTSLPGAPPPYEQATDPTFMQRFHKFSEGFHPAEVSRFARQLSGEMSGNGQNPKTDPERLTHQTSENNQDLETEARETNAETEARETNELKSQVNWCKFLMILILLVVSIAMVVVGSIYNGNCDGPNPHPIWLLVTGLSILTPVLIFAFISCSKNRDISICWAYGMFAGIIWAVVMFFYGCHNILGTTHKWWRYQQSNCYVPFYFSLVVVFISIALVVIGGVRYLCRLQW